MATFLYLCAPAEGEVTDLVFHGEFEEEHSVHTKLEFCPQCEKEGRKTAVVRLICSVAKGVVELYGQDLVDKVKADAQLLKKEMHKNDNIYANMLGESRYNDIQTKMDRNNR